MLKVCRILYSVMRTNDHIKLLHCEIYLRFLYKFLNDNIIVTYELENMIYIIFIYSCDVISMPHDHLVVNN